jgi:hypothetical protein
VDLTEPVLDELTEMQEQDSVDCTLFLSDGSRLKGRLFTETPAFSSRLLDKLNHGPRFVPFTSADGVDFIQKSHVVRVR